MTLIIIGTPDYRHPVITDTPAGAADQSAGGQAGGVLRQLAHLPLSHLHGGEQQS